MTEVREITARYSGTCPRCLGRWKPGTPLVSYDGRWRHRQCDPDLRPLCHFCREPTWVDEYHSPQGWVAHMSCAWDQGEETLTRLVKTCHDLRLRGGLDCPPWLGCLATRSYDCPLRADDWRRRW